MRGYTINQVADMIGINYKTFSGILNRDVVDAKLLFELANLLNIDLCWMAQLYEKKRTISTLEQYQMSRMNSEMRESEQALVLSCLDRHIQACSGKVNEIKSMLLQDFKQLFYLLDVMLPETYIIRIVFEHQKEKYYCMPTTPYEQKNLLGGIRGAKTNFYEGHEMLKLIIHERKARLGL